MAKHCGVSQKFIQRIEKELIGYEAVLSPNDPQLEKSSINWCWSRDVLGKFRSLRRAITKIDGSHSLLPRSPKVQLPLSYIAYGVPRN